MSIVIIEETKNTIDVADAPSILVITEEHISIVSEGIQGPPGPAGANGAAGAQGPAGSNGTNGINGIGVPAGGSTGQVLAKASSSNYDTIWQTVSGGGGSGDVTGPSSSTDNAIARFDSTSGKMIQNSAATIDDSGNIISASGKLSVGTVSTNYEMDVRSATTAANIHLGPNGNDYGLYLSTNTIVNDAAYMGGGACLASDSSSWIAKGTNPVLFGAYGGNVRIFCDSGKTPGTNYTPTERFTILTNGQTGINAASPSAFLHVVGTSEQLRLGYNGANYVSATVDGSGNIIFNATGTSPEFTFSDPVNVPDEAYGAGWNGNSEVPTKNALYDKIESLGGGGSIIVQEEGASLTARTILNFIGGGFTASDDAGNARTNITLDSTLNAFAAYNTNGILTQTAADSFTGRTITGTANQVTVTNGNGVAGNPTLSLPQNIHSSATPTFSTLTLSGGQIAFPATQNPSSDPNTLDDYEEGSWTPVLTFVTPGNLSVSYSEQVGSYIKIGRMVVLHFSIVTSSFTHSTASGLLKITGAPFSNSNATGLHGTGPLVWAGITKANYTSYSPSLNTGGTDIFFSASGSGQPTSNPTAADLPSAGTIVMRGCITYLA